MIISALSAEHLRTLKKSTLATQRILRGSPEGLRDKAHCLLVKGESLWLSI